MLDFLSNDLIAANISTFKQKISIKKIRKWKRMVYNQRLPIRN
jgi:hypothetical protein